MCIRDRPSYSDPSPSHQRSRISAHYASRYGVSVSPDAIMVTTGSSAAFVLGFLAMFDAGDRVAVARPGYPCYVNILEAMGVEVISLPVDARTNFQPTVEMLEDAVRGDDDGDDDDTNNDALASESDEPGSNPAGGKNRRRRRTLRGVIVASPSNPTGTVLSRDQLSSRCASGAAAAARGSCRTRFTTRSSTDPCARRRRSSVRIVLRRVATRTRTTTAGCRTWR